MIPIRDNIPTTLTPVVTWSIMILCTLIFLWLQWQPEDVQKEIVYTYGMVPMRYSNPFWAESVGLEPDGYFSFISSLFLHSSWTHILMNLVFMWIFADNIEDLMGHGRFILFYLVCGVLATFLQWYYDPRMVFPVIGASGAIAGILGAYFFLYPNARVIFLIPILFFPLVFEVPAIGFLGGWVIIQLHQATTSVMFDGVATDVAWWAHLGGFIAGAFLHPLFIKQSEPEEES